jgi:hypothetical protein
LPPSSISPPPRALAVLLDEDHARGFEGASHDAEIENLGRFFARLESPSGRAPNADVRGEIR